MEPRHFEDLAIGDEFTSKGRTVTETDMMSFLGISGIFEEHYINAEYASQKSIFKQRFIPGALTFSLAEGLAVQSGLFEGTGLALLEVTVKFVAPVFLGDTLHVKMRVTDKRETKHPERGVVTFKHEVNKQTGETVMEMTKIRMLRRRRAPAAVG